MPSVPISTSGPDDITASLPFDLDALIAWADKYNNSPNRKNISHNYFDDTLVKIVIDNSGNFINDFLSANMIFNTDFVSSLSVSTGTRKTSTYNQQLSTSSESGATATSGATAKSSYDIKAPDGGNIKIYGNPGKQRVAVRDKCNKQHLYYPEGCGTILFNEGQVDEYYACNCTGNLAMNTSSNKILHTHCSEFTNDIADPVLAYNASLKGSAGLQMAKYQTGQIDKFGYKIKMANGIRYSENPAGSGNYYNTDDLEVGKETEYTSSNGELTDVILTNTATTKVSYENSRNLQYNNVALKTLIYDYYKALSVNYNLNKNIASANSSTTGSIAMQDSNVKYRMEYLNAFNLFSGIIIISGYVYTNFRNV